MKTLKVDNGYYDKVKQLSDASGESLFATCNGVVAAGLGELKGLGDVLKQKPKPKIGRPVEAALDPGEELGEEEEEQEEEGGYGWFWAVAAVVGGLAVMNRINQARARQVQLPPPVM